MDLAELRPEFERTLKALDPAALAATDNTWKSFRSGAPAGFALALQVLNDGNTQPTFDQLPKMLAMPDSNNYGDKSHIRRWTVGYVFGPILHRAEDRMSGNKPFNEAALLKVCDQLARTMPAGRDTSAADNVSARATALTLLHHARSGSLGDFDAWRKTLSAEESKKAKDQFTKDKTGLWIVLQNAFGKPKPHVTLEDRTKIVSTLLTNDWVAALLAPQGTSVPNLCATLVTGQKLFTPDEFKDVAATFAKQLPRDGRTASEAGELLAANGKVAESVALFDLAIGATADLNVKASYQFKKAESLERLNQKPEAVTLLKAMPKDKLGPQNQKTLESMLKRLGVE
jgi:hypothetical protein